jgi:hypothetical protein
MAESISAVQHGRYSGQSHCAERAVTSLTERMIQAIGKSLGASCEFDVSVRLFSVDKDEVSGVVEAGCRCWAAIGRKRCTSIGRAASSR